MAVPGLSWGMWILVPWPGIKPQPPTLGSQTLNHLIIREVPLIAFYSQLQLELKCKLSWIRSQGKLTFQESVNGGRVSLRSSFVWQVARLQAQSWGSLAYPGVSFIFLLRVTLAKGCVCVCVCVCVCLRRVFPAFKILFYLCWNLYPKSCPSSSHLW